MIKKSRSMRDYFLSCFRYFSYSKATLHFLFVCLHAFKFFRIKSIVAYFLSIGFYLNPIGRPFNDTIVLVFLYTRNLYVHIICRRLSLIFSYKKDKTRMAIYIVHQREALYIRYKFKSKLKMHYID